MSRYLISIISILFVVTFLPFAKEVGASPVETSQLIASQDNGCGLENGTAVSFGQMIRSDKTEGQAVAGPIAVSIAAGEYDIALTSYDDHGDKPDQNQTQESWFVIFRAGEEVVAVSGTIRDLPEGQDWLTEQVNTRLSIPKNVDNIIAKHAAYPNSDIHSVVPSCVGLRRFEELMKVQVEGLLYCDDNQNQRRDEGERGLQNIGVQLLPTPETRHSDPNGHFQFSPQDEGSYDVQPSIPAGLHETGRVVHASERENMTVYTYQIGLYGDCVPIIEATIGNFVWLDTNRNGLQDSGELGKDGVTVVLTNLDTGEQKTETTDGSGHYLFTNLEPGSYQLRFLPPAGYIVTTPNMGDDRMDSDINPADGLTDTTTLDPNEVDLSWDAGIYTEEEEKNRFACARFNLDLGRSAKTGAGVVGVYKMYEVSTGNELASWDADFWWADSGWIEGIKLSHVDGSWVEVYFYPTSGTPHSVKLEVINPAPGTQYGWLYPGMCHAIEIQFPADWNNGQPVAPVVESPVVETTVVDAPVSSIETAVATEENEKTAVNKISAAKMVANSLFRGFIQ